MIPDLHQYVLFESGLPRTSPLIGTSPLVLSVSIERPSSGLLEVDPLVKQATKELALRGSPPGLMAALDGIWGGLHAVC